MISPSICKNHKYLICFYDLDYSTYRIREHKLATALINVRRTIRLAAGREYKYVEEENTLVTQVRGRFDPSVDADDDQIVVIEDVDKWDEYKYINTAISPSKCQKKTHCSNAHFLLPCRWIMTRPLPESDAVFLRWAPTQSMEKQNITIYVVWLFFYSYLYRFQIYADSFSKAVNIDLKELIGHSSSMHM